MKIKYSNMTFLLSFLGILFSTCVKDPPINISVTENSIPVNPTAPQTDCASIIIDDSLFNLIQQYDTNNANNFPAFYIVKSGIDTFGSCIEFTITYKDDPSFQNIKMVWDGNYFIDENGDYLLTLYLYHHTFPFITWDSDYDLMDKIMNFDLVNVDEKMQAINPSVKIVTVIVKTYWNHVDKKFTYKIK